MTVGKVLEITAESKKGFKDAIQEGIERTAKNVKGIQSAWIKEQKVVVEGGQVKGYRVDLKITFLVED